MNFSLNGVSCTTHGIQVISISNRHSIPKKQYESIEVPGRTGNLLIDTGARLNKDITIQWCIDCGDLTNAQLLTKLKAIQEWLIGPIGYQTLMFEDGGKFNAIVKDIAEVIHYQKDNVLVYNTIFECYEVIQ